MILSSFDITFIKLKAIKVQTLTNLLAFHPQHVDSHLNDVLFDKLVMSIEGATSDH